MKKITFVLGLLLVSLAGMAQKNVVNVETAGTLQQVLEEQGLTQAEELTITGELNGDDIRHIRSLAGGCYEVLWRWYHEDSEYPKPTYTLKRLDLSGARIVEGGGQYNMGTSVSSSMPDVVRYTENDVIGKDMFAFLETMEEFVLPNVLIKIDNFGLDGCKLTEVNIPEGVTSLGVGSLGESTLKKVVLPSTLTAIESSAFWGSMDLRSITVNAVEPPSVIHSIDQTDFEDYVTSQVVLTVPDESVEKYRNHPQWGKFVNISSNKAPTAVNQVERADNAPSAWYSYDGRQLTSPAKGLNIVRMKDGSVKKVMVR